jgi:two-component system, NtrC family, sensor kinase
MIDNIQINKDKITILIIEDSITFQHYLKDILEEQGYSVITADSAEEGLKVTVIQRPDAIIIDSMLPGIDGNSFIQKIRSDSAIGHTPCVLLTESEELKGELKALDAGADAYIRKDEDISVILMRLKTLLRSLTKSNIPNFTIESLYGLKRVLVIDDSITYLNKIAELLKEGDYEIILASSGKEAFVILETQLVDCILLDLHLPEMTGEEICREIKQSSQLKLIPIVVLTGSDDIDAMKKSFNAGADDYIPKSSEIEVIKARLKAQLRRKQFEHESSLLREQLYKREVEAAEAKANKELAESRAKLLLDLEQKNSELAIMNRELETFSYSVSHDLRAPLRSILGFTKIILDDFDSSFNEESKAYFLRIMNSAQQMGQLIDGLLELSRLTRKEIRNDTVDFSIIANEIIEELKKTEPERNASFSIAEKIVVKGDAVLLRTVLENLISNAWKFTSKIKDQKIEFGIMNQNKKTVYYVKDNGAGFNMQYSNKLFQTFQRLHSNEEFKGTGVGLATVQRIIHRHNGRIWAESELDQGATFFFTLQEHRE